MLFLFSKFKQRKWKKYSPDKRLRILQALENKMAKKQHREAVPVRVKDTPNWNCYGMFSINNGEKMIYVNEELLYNDKLRFHALETIIHEGRHAYQYIIVQKNLHWYNFKEKRWKKNWQNYFTSSEDRIMYNNQAIERDAQSYTIKKLKRLEYKYRNEDDFYNTLRANTYRFENAEDDARKKYGIFYKLKINRNVKNKNK